MRKALVLITAVVAAVIAVAAVVRLSGSASKSLVARRDTQTIAGEASGNGPIGNETEQPAAAMPSREVERQETATAQVAASPTSQEMPTTIGFPSRETARESDGEGDASSPTDDDESRKTPQSSTQALTQAVNELFDYCNVTSGGDANRKQRCERAGVLAEQIVSVPKTSADSWAYGMESELDRHLTELSQAGAGWGVVERKEVRCNALGCVVYMEGPARWGYSFARLISAIKSDALIAQLNEQRPWPAPGAWDQKVGNQAILVLPRP